jgi:uncharacterized repeat protein (TIGR04042 family)
MPELRVVVRWPDDSIMTCYSPSLVIREYLEVGSAYPVAEFVERSRAALAIASDRVREKYGFACVRAAHALAEIEAKARALGADPSGAVRVESFHD